MRAKGRDPIGAPPSFSAVPVMCGGGGEGEYLPYEYGVHRDARDGAYNVGDRLRPEGGAGAEGRGQRKEGGEVDDLAEGRERQRQLEGSEQSL